MDALILAAGLGSRLRDLSPCKPLTELHGLTLLEIAIRQLAGVGAKRVVVAVGYMGEAIESTLPAIATKVGIAVEARRVEDFLKPNGYSVIAGAADFRDEFLLVMADHLFSQNALRGLVDHPGKVDGVLLAIDRRLDSPLVDPDDATWVQTGSDGAIVAIGKSISTFDAVDSGAFRATPDLPSAIQEAISEGLPGSLSDGVQRLARSGKAHTVDICESWWLDVDDARAFAVAKEQVVHHLPEVFGQAATKAAGC